MLAYHNKDIRFTFLWHFREDLPLLERHIWEHFTKDCFGNRSDLGTIGGTTHTLNNRAHYGRICLSNYTLPR